MGREIVICWAGRHARSEWEMFYERYRRRIERFVPIQEKAIRVRRQGEPTARIEAEGERLIDALPSPLWSVALDRRGVSRSSEEFAAWLKRLQHDWPHPIVFLLGSDLGLSRQVLDRCKETVSFGPMTLPHELARLVLYEQLYRALSLLAGIKYHRGPL